MSIQGIDAVLQQMQVTATKAAGGVDSTTASQSGFASELKAAIEKINETRTQAQAQGEAFTLGKPGVALNDVMIDNQKASIALQMGVQVRNKLVSAYQEVMNMTI